MSSHGNQAQGRTRGNEHPISAWTLARARILSPSWNRALVRPLAVFSHAWVKCGLWLLGLVVQAVLLTLTWELVGVVADVSELWLALARKHLELTL